MKQLHTSEIKNITIELQSFLDAKMQKFFATEKGLGLELRKANETFYLWFELDATNPLILLFKKIPSVFKLLKTSPLLLFARAHLEGKRVSEIRHLAEFGRVIELEFGYDNPLKLEIRLFPHGTNAIAHFEKKRVAFDRIKEAKTSDAIEDLPNPRSIGVITEEWLSEKLNKVKKQQDPELIKNKEIEKKEKALLKTNEHLLELQNDKWAKLGEWLKENQSLKVPKEFQEYVDTKKSFSQNIQTSFEKAKKNQEKLSGTLDRIKILENEIAKLKSQTPESFVKKPETSKIKKVDNWKGYRFTLDDKAEVFVGKNAQENLNILRFAQSWDYWMHIKDYPGAHGIIRRTRNYEITDEQMRIVAQFVAQKSKKSAHFLGPGDDFDVLIAECRYVKPIKGDKLGRVTYSSERVLHCKMPAK